MANPTDRFAKTGAKPLETRNLAKVVATPAGVRPAKGRNGLGRQTARNLLIDPQAFSGAVANLPTSGGSELGRIHRLGRAHTAITVGGRRLGDFGTFNQAHAALVDHAARAELAAGWEFIGDIVLKVLARRLRERRL